MRNFLIRIIRDNEVVNWLGRRIVKVFAKIVKPVNRIIPLYRVYGKIKVELYGAQFKIYAKADDHIANDLYYGHEYEDGEFKLLKLLTSDSNYLIDVGANTGIFSIYAASLNSRLNVLSFEPYPSNYKRMLTNISINNLKNIKAFDIALGTTETQIEFTVPADLGISTTTSANTEFTRNFHRMDYKTISVRQTKLDEILISVPITSLDVLKIDVEYYELEVLMGAEETLRNKRPMIIVELLNYEGLIRQFPGMEGKLAKTHAEDIVHFLTDLGYYIYAIGLGGLVEGRSGADERNFLFMPYKLPYAYIRFDEVPAVFASI